MKFILNNQVVQTSLPSGTILLDFIRYHKNLSGTKIGCREGDCGACTVLIGELINNELKYKSVTSCLTAIGNINLTHVVTVEGINFNSGLNPIQQAMCAEGATQCGFCTPGFVVSLAGFCLSSGNYTENNAIAAIDGNICRCTGYKSIQKAAIKVAEIMQQNTHLTAIEYVCQQQILPNYFSEIKSRLQILKTEAEAEAEAEINNSKTLNPSTNQLVGGGTDLYVQKPHELISANLNFTQNNKQLKSITQQNQTITIGSAVTVSELLNQPIFTQYFPNFNQHVKLVSSTPIRNLATIAGNFINASPIGDFTIFFLALNAQILLSNGTTSRQIALKNFYNGYKQLNKQPNEFIVNISFIAPNKHTYFNFEKVSKRTHLDIASVNTAACIQVENNIIQQATISAGGVGPFPMVLLQTSMFLKNKVLNNITLQQALQIAQTEISPISDARGSSQYKKLLLNNLIIAHFYKLFPQHIQIQQLLNANI